MFKIVTTILVGKSKKFNFDTGWGEPRSRAILELPHVIEPTIVSMNRSGQGLIYWYCWDGMVWVTYYDGNQWHKVEEIIHLEPPHVHVQSASGDISENGSIIMVFEYRDLSNSQNIRDIYALHHAPNSEWSSPVLIETEPGHSAHRPGIGLDKYGNGIAIWLEWDLKNQRQSIHVNRFVVGSGWGTNHVIDALLWSSDYASLSVADDGTAIVGWAQDKPYITHFR